MGQKIHPLGFRLGITQTHRSIWYNGFYYKEYAKYLEEDQKIRSYFEKDSKKNKITKVTIERSCLNRHIKVLVELGKPKELLGIKGEKIGHILKNLSNLVKSKQKIILDVKKVDIRSNADLVAYDIVEKLEKRIPFRIAMQSHLNLKNRSGIKIQISGRLNGADIARIEWNRKGRVPLHTLSADIDYASKEAHTIYGIIGVKVWLFKSSMMKI